MALRFLNALPGNAFENLPLPQARAQIDAEARIFGSALPVRQVEDITIPTRAGGVPGRTYEHNGDRLGTVVYFHGGGWVLGSLDSADSICRFIAHHLEVRVVAVDYRLAPEHPFPAAVEDAIDAYRWARRTPGSVSVAGDSAGGNLSAVIALECRDDPPDAQLLFFPVTDLSRESESYRKFADGFFLTRKQMRWYGNHYVKQGESADVRVSPLLADLGDEKGIAPAHVAVAGFDVLRDEGVAYAEKLKNAGVPTTLQVVTGHIHAFTNATGVGITGTEALRESVEVLRGMLERASEGKARAKL